jgi:adenylosuccinate synthase
MGTLQVIVGGQAGSEGKGAVAAHLASDAATRGVAFAAVRVAGPNAGHSAVDPAGRKWALRSIPVAAVVNPDAALYIAAGSEVDLGVLCAEADALEEGGHKIYDRLFIDQMATVLEPIHLDQERTFSLTERIGSTGKGIGAARAERIWRTARTIRDLADDTTDDRIARFAVSSDTSASLQAQLEYGITVQVEGTQGHWLGLHHQNYPQVTSSNCRAVDFLAMAGISPWHPAIEELEIWVTLRPYPIRVAGNSGPLREETSWEQLGLPEEKTTVTQKIRRVGHWDAELARAAVRANGGGGSWSRSPVRLALTMADQLSPELTGATDAHQLTDRVIEFIHMVQRDTGSTVHLLGTSDRTMIQL